MYCNCKSKKPLTNEANKVTFTVCAKSKGGCGREIRESIDDLLKQFEDILEDEYPPTICPYCDGDGFVRVPFSNPVELDFCSNCSGGGRL